MDITSSIISTEPSGYISAIKEVVYAHRDTRDLKMQIFFPEMPAQEEKNTKVRPLIVDGIQVTNRHRGDDNPRPQRQEGGGKRYPAVLFCMGSGFDGTRGFGRQDVAIELARGGFVTAIIEYRGSLLDHAHYPAYVQDCKEAVRFLRTNAEQFRIDPTHIALMGESSGGNAAAMAGLTPGDPLFEIGEHLNQSSDVSAVICFFGPVDPQYLLSDRLKEHKTLRPGEAECDPDIGEIHYAFEAHEIYDETFEEDPEKHAFECSVSNHLKAGTNLPALAYFVGDEDDLIPMEQGLRLCRNLRNLGGRAEFYRIIGGSHGADCYFEGSLQLVKQFLHRFI